MQNREMKDNIYRLTVILIFLCLNSCREAQENECFSLKTLLEHYKVYEEDYGYFLAENDQMTFFIQGEDIKIETYWLSPGKKVKKYQMYYWPNGTTRSRFTMNFSERKCKILSSNGGPFFIGTNFHGIKNFKEDSLIFDIYAAVIPFFENNFEILSINLNDSTTQLLFSGKLDRHRTRVVDQSLANGDYLLIYSYQLYQDQIDYVVDTVTAILEYEKEAAMDLNIQ